MNGRSKSVVVTFAVAMAVGLVAEARQEGSGKAKRRTAKQRVSRSSNGTRSTRRARTCGHKPGKANGYSDWGRDDVSIKPSLYDSPGDDTFRPRRLRYDSPGDDTFKARRLPHDSPGNDKLRSRRLPFDGGVGDDTVLFKPRRLTTHKRGKPSLHDSPGNDTFKYRRLRFSDAGAADQIKPEVDDVIDISTPNVEEAEAPGTELRQSRRHPRLRPDQALRQSRRRHLRQRSQ